MKSQNTVNHTLNTLRDPFLLLGRDSTMFIIFRYIFRFTFMPLLKIFTETKPLRRFPSFGTLN